MKETTHLAARRLTYGVILLSLMAIPGVAVPSPSSGADPSDRLHDVSELPQWQQEILKDVEIHARYVSGDQLGCLDHLLPVPIFTATHLDKDVYLLTRYQVTSAKPRKRVLKLEAEIVAPFRLAGREISLIPVGGNVCVRGSCYSLTKVVAADAVLSKGDIGQMKAAEPRLRIVNVWAK